MKRVLVCLLFGMMLVASAFALRRCAGHATPDACLHSYYTALRSGDDRACLHCFADPNRTQLGDLRTQARDLRAWTITSEERLADDRVAVWVEEQYPAVRRRGRFVLEQQAGGWRIVERGTPREIAQDIPYGTHISATMSRPPQSLPADPDNEE